MVGAVTKQRRRLRRTLLSSPCHYCGASSENRDHVVPRSLGGADEVWNLVPSCEPCNQAKADSWPTCPCAVCVAAVERMKSYV